MLPAGEAQRERAAPSAGTDHELIERTRALLAGGPICNDDRDFLVRIVAACRMLELLRQAIEKNGGKYTGSLIPNSTSVLEILAGTTSAELLTALDSTPSLMRDLNTFPNLAEFHRDGRKLGIGFKRP